MRPALALARRPLETAELIPLAAAGRQALFFFGTLTDLDVLAYVLQRPLDLDDLAPARLAGFRRVWASGVSYPILVADPQGSVEGRLLRRATRRDIARINHFESGEYRAELHSVMTGDAVARPAWLYRGLDHLAAMDEPWSLAAWQAAHKPGFFAACDGWMADCPDGD
jgi:gamma-glutamylcyclotransferase (GGCT)/AIG2-like uncharacterized protein YtfP